MQIKNNQDRAESAYRAVAKFSGLTSLNMEEMETQISDLLCNLQHLADEQGIDFQACLENGSRYYQAEVQQESQGTST